MERRRAVFVDRDGTLNQDSGYVLSPDQFHLLPGVPEAIVRLNALGLLVIMITNQSAIGRGLMTERDLSHIHDKLTAILSAQGGTIDEVYWCPHHPDEACICRKPSTGLIEQAQKEFSLHLPECFFVGDKQSDLEAAKNAHIPAILVMSSPHAQEAMQARDEGRVPVAHVAEDFTEAVLWIEGQLTKGDDKGVR